MLNLDIPFCVLVTIYVFPVNATKYLRLLNQHFWALAGQRQAEYI
jgi:hypothetical protein